MDNASNSLEMTAAESARAERAAFARAFEKREAFRKYAAFVSREMGIEVVFGAPLEPGERGAVSLPEPETLSEAEIDLLYGVLLREAGRERHSLRSVEDHACLPTANALALASAIESSRVESLLAAEFDGAAEILERLRSEQVLAPGMARKAFGWEKNQPSEWEAFCHLASSALFFGRSAGLELIAEPKVARAASESASRVGLAEALASPPKSFSESAALASRIHQAYFSGSNKDDSEPLRVQERADALAKSREILEKAQAEIDRLQAEAAAQSKTLRSQRGESKIRQEARERQLEALGRQAAPFARAMETLRAAVDEIQRSRSNQAKAEAAAERAAKSGSRGESARSRIEELTAKLEKARADLEKARADADASKTETLEAREASLSERLQSAQNTLAHSERLERERKAAADAAAASSEELLRQAMSQLSKAIESSSSMPEGTGAAMREALEALAKAMEQRGASGGESSSGEASGGESSSGQASGGQSSGGESSSGQASGDPLSQALERLQGLANSLSAPLQSMQTQASSLESASYSERMALRKDSSALRELQRSLANARDAALAEAHKTLTDAGLPSELVPEFEPSGWDGADKAQMEFDAMASKETGASVKNGVGGGSLRAAVSLGEALDEIDLSEFFRQSAGKNPIDAFGDADGEAPGSDGSLSPEGSSRSVPAHMPSTTAFDSTRQALSRKAGFDLAALRRRLAPQIERSRRLFASRMRISRKERFRGNLDEGSLDARSIWKLAANMGDDFREMPKKIPHNSSAAAILVDLSGSLDQDPRRAERLRDIAFVLSAGLSAAHARHEVLGHHAPHSPEMAAFPASPRHTRRSHRLETVVFRGFASKSLDGLSNIEPQVSENCDGEAIRTAWKRLKRESARSKALFVLTDGKPHLPEADPDILDADVRRAAAEARAGKARVFGIGLGCDPAFLFGEGDSCQADDWDSLFAFLDKALSS